MKPLQTIKLLVAAGLALSLLTLAPPRANAQARTRRSSSSSSQKKRRTSSSSPTTGADSTTVNAARIKLADRVKTLSQFLYIYGRLSKDLELSGAQSSASGGDDRSKAAVLASVRNVRAGLDDLASQFRSTPGLERQSGELTAAARRAADAESAAAAGQYHQAGLALVEVVKQLTDVLVDM
ncbi:MAG: hypothetical protein LC746_13305 [Acidobacteria bacterium]|nr:hypothetical protein [Acidobacteriota bacterium]